MSASGGKKHNFGQILTFEGLLYRPLLPMSVTFGMLQQTHADLYASRPTLRPTCQISSRSVYYVALWRRKTRILPFFGLQHLVMSTVNRNLRKLNTSAQLQAFPYPTTWKLFLVSVLQRLHGEIGRTNSYVQKCDEQTDRQTDRQKKLNVFGRPGGWWNPSPTKLCLVIEDLEHVLVPRKVFGSDA